MRTGPGLTALFLVFIAASAWAQDEKYCRLEQPQVASGSITVHLTCSAEKEADAVLYPDGTLYVGASLYSPWQGYEGLVAPVTDMGGADLDLEAKEVTAAIGTQELKLEFEPSDIYTHVLIAVWDRKNECPSSDGGRCSTFGYTLGVTDFAGLPMPIDAWPRPFCDVEKLLSSGFFDWVADELEPDEMLVPNEFSSMYQSNDCWSYDPERPGLQVSLRNWRAAPLSGE